MNTLTIIIMALQTAASALHMAAGFVTDAKVKEIMDEVSKAIDYAVTRLWPHQEAAQKAARAGRPVPATAPQQGKPGAAMATAPAPSPGEPGPDEEEQDEMASDPPDDDSQN